MWELRWVLSGLGIALIVGVYLWGRGIFKRANPAKLFKRFAVGSVRLKHPEGAAPSASVSSDEQAPEQPAKKLRRADRVVTVRFVPKDQSLAGEEVVLALRAAGLKHGEYGIFHRFPDSTPGDVLFSVANLTEPGSFDLKDIAQTTVPGMSFFMVLPGSGDPVARFDLMVQTARLLAHDLHAELHDEKGSSWSIQRERYVREEIIAYRHQHERV